jgi:hypothetical protein
MLCAIVCHDNELRATFVSGTDDDYDGGWVDLELDPDGDGSDSGGSENELDDAGSTDESEAESGGSNGAWDCFWLAGSGLFVVGWDWIVCRWVGLDCLSILEPWFISRLRANEEPMTRRL